MGYKAAIFGNSCQFYEYASFLVENNGTTIRYRLHVGEVVTIMTEDEGWNFAILRSIFSHQRQQRFAFIIVDWFEITSQTKLECPIYKLRIESKYRRIFPITKVDISSTVHFVHDCKEVECVEGHHNNNNNLYIRNLYFFKAV
jgi:hypothetical protein